MAIFDEFPYTNFHDKNLDGMCKAIGENRNQIELNKNKIGVMRIDVDRIDALTQEMHGQVSRHEIGLNAQAQRLTTLELDDQKHTRDIAELDGEVADHETRITALEQGGGGGGGFAWTDGDMVLDGTQNHVRFKYNINTMMLLIPKSDLFVAQYKKEGGQTVITNGAKSIDIPNGYQIRFVEPMYSSDSAEDSRRPFNVEWTISKDSSGTIRTSGNLLQYGTSAVGGTLTRGSVSQYPIYGVILPM